MRKSENQDFKSTAFSGLVALTLAAACNGGGAVEIKDGSYDSMNNDTGSADDTESGSDSSTDSHDTRDTSDTLDDTILSGVTTKISSGVAECFADVGGSVGDVSSDGIAEVAVGCNETGLLTVFGGVDMLQSGAEIGQVADLSFEKAITERYDHAPQNMIASFDGYQALGSPGAGSGNGAVLLFNGLNGTMDSTDADLSLTGEAQSQAGYAVLALNQGADETGLAVVAPSMRTGDDHVYILSEAPSANGSLNDHADMVISSTDPSGTGPSTAVQADFNSDGLMDLALGNPTAGLSAGTGSVYVNYGPQDTNLDISDTHFQISTSDIGAGYARSLATADFDGDGYEDLVVGSYSGPGVRTNAVNVYSGSEFRAGSLETGDLTTLLTLDDNDYGESVGVLRPSSDPSQTWLVTPTGNGATVEVRTGEAVAGGDASEYQEYEQDFSIGTVLIQAGNTTAYEGADSVFVLSASAQTAVGFFAGPVPNAIP